METIYNWLLENTGNAGHYYTILNARRKDDPGESAHLEIMAIRTDDFSVVNLLIFAKPTADEPDANGNGQLVASYVFSDEQQVIDYIANGTEPQGVEYEETTAIRVSVVEPGGEAGSLMFPPEQ